MAIIFSFYIQNALEKSQQFTIVGLFNYNKRRLKRHTLVRNNNRPIQKALISDMATSGINYCLTSSLPTTEEVLGSVLANSNQLFLDCHPEIQNGSTRIFRP
jgi:hypothetical protein